MALSPQEEIEYLLLLEKEAKQKEVDKAFSPQPGPQETFLNTTADIAIYGGAAGGGKTYALLIENVKHIDNKRFGSVIFRRTMADITKKGAIWDNAMELYPLKGAVPVKNPQYVMRFPSGATVTFSHLHDEKSLRDWQGAQIPLICFDELTHFSRSQFLYLLSRNRSTSGVRGYIRCTCNPDATSWVADFISWYIDQATGFPIKERSGVIRYFTIIDDKEIWGDTVAEVVDQCGIKPNLVKSFTFIASSIFDNKIQLEKDPGYLANLNALGTVEKGRLLHGNWKIKAAAGMYFKRTQVQVVGSIPSKIRRYVRAWDLAASIPTPQNSNPDYTAGVLMGKMEDGRYIILDLIHGRWVADDVRKKVLKTAKQDKARYGRVMIRLPQDPAQSGKEQAQSYIKMLSGYVVKAKRMTGDKTTRAEPFASQWQAGNVLILAGAWNDEMFMEYEGFPSDDKSSHDDIVDAGSDAFTELQKGRSWQGACS